MATSDLPSAAVECPYGRVVIKSHPFQSSAGARLVTALDDENEALYPDFKDFPYEGAGDWLRGVPDITPLPGLASKSELETEKPPLYFFAVFPFDVLEQSGDDHEKIEESAVACAAVQVLPWFPSHFPPSGASSDRDSAVSEVTTSTDTELRTAEMKRLYVVPSYRGRPESKRTDGSVERSVASLLIEFVEKFAREQMHVQRLVLETGARQIGAMKVYSRAGWTRRKGYGTYAGSDESLGGLSRCFEKVL